MLTITYCQNAIPNGDTCGTTIFAPMTINAYVTAAPIPVAIATASAGEPSSPASAISASPGADNASATSPTRDRRSGEHLRRNDGDEDRSRVDGQDRDGDRRALQRLEEEHPVEREQQTQPEHMQSARRKASASRPPSTSRTSGA